MILLHDDIITRWYYVMIVLHDDIITWYYYTMTLLHDDIIEKGNTFVDTVI